MSGWPDRNRLGHTTRNSDEALAVKAYRPHHSGRLCIKICQNNSLYVDGLDHSLKFMVKNQQVFQIGLLNQND